MNYTIQRATSLHGIVSVPGDKSITHRALLLSGLAEGHSRIEGFLDSGDCHATMGCLEALGVAFERPSQDTLIVTGKGLHGLQEPEDVLNCIRSGTTMRLLAGILAAQPFYCVLSGDSQLRRRPMDRIITPLRRMGAQITGRANDRLPPLTIVGRPLMGTEHVLPVASAQVKSCLLLAGLYAQGTTVIHEPALSRDHTERMLRGRGVPIHSEGLTHHLTGPVDAIAAVDVRVPGDFSSAAYLIVAALLVPHSEILVQNVGVNPTRTGLLDALTTMGADISLENEHQEGGEPVADIRVRTSSMRGTTICGDLVPRMIDEFPILALAATQAEGETHVRDAAELRVKETDRIATTTQALRAMGAHIEPKEDGFIIYGPTPLIGATVSSYGDHRLGMTLAVAGLIAQGETIVCNAECIGDSFPNFGQILHQISGGAIQ